MLMQKQEQKCVFFDRDGIVNQSPGPGYVERWEDLHILPEFIATLRSITSRGFIAIIITNQRGIALGKMTLKSVNDMHSRLQKLLKEMHDLELTDIFVCPHEKDSCECRKPKPGMFLAAAKKHNIDLKASWMIGDHVKDVEAGKAAGCRTILVSSALKSADADFAVASMTELQSLVDKVIGID